MKRGPPTKWSARALLLASDAELHHRAGRLSLDGGGTRVSRLEPLPAGAPPDLTTVLHVQRRLKAGRLEVRRTAPVLVDSSPNWPYPHSSSAIREAASSAPSLDNRETMPRAALASGRPLARSGSFELPGPAPTNARQRVAGPRCRSRRGELDELRGRSAPTRRRPGYRAAR